MQRRSPLVGLCYELCARMPQVTSVDELAFIRRVFTDNKFQIAKNLRGVDALNAHVRNVFAATAYYALDQEHAVHTLMLEQAAAARVTNSVPIRPLSSADVPCDVFLRVMRASTWAPGEDADLTAQAFHDWLVQPSGVHALLAHRDVEGRPVHNAKAWRYAVRDDAGVVRHIGLLETNIRRLLALPFSRRFMQWAIRYLETNVSVTLVNSLGVFFEHKLAFWEAQVKKEQEQQQQTPPASQAAAANAPDVVSTTHTATHTTKRTFLPRSFVPFDDSSSSDEDDIENEPQRTVLVKTSEVRAGPLVVE